MNCVGVPESKEELQAQLRTVLPSIQALPSGLRWIRDDSPTCRH